MANSPIEARPRLTVILILVPRALHDSNGAVVKVPFSFSIGHTELEGGRYTVRLDKKILRLTAENSTKGEDCDAITVANATDSASGTLVFVECGGRYFLSKAFWPLGQNAFEKEELSSEARAGAMPRPYQNPIQSYAYMFPSHSNRVEIAPG
jgi:hypothetical protein